MKTWLSCLLILASGWCLAGNGAYLGVNIGHLHEASDHHQHKDQPGVLVTGVVEGSGAAKAGIQRHDIIANINGEAINAPDELISYLNAMNAGETVTLKVIRDEKPMEIQAQLSERLLRRQRADRKKWVIMADHHRAWLGVEYEALNPDLASFFGVDSGILIKKVSDESPAKTAGLQAGDIILSMAGAPMASTKEFLKSMADREEGDNVALEVNRRGEVLDVNVTLGSAESRPRFNFNFNFGDEHFESLHELPENFHTLKPMLERLEFGDMENLQLQLKELREELNRLKKERDDNH